MTEHPDPETVTNDAPHSPLRLRADLNDLTNTIADQLHTLSREIGRLVPDADPPTVAYAAAELRNAAERIRAAITQLEGLRP